ncbi:hypothetical protein O181_090547 [Austropuccinia psidii MF-1]|uniref:Uncharacterized protein n=1 Tax=Austropuccinia psidii MF-1 TaxID=1389203 RepID=A0A9Q3IVR5_9BASI|nr:hypothetical protein [Austropuccinia psidii MF-1]
MCSRAVVLPSTAGPVIGIQLRKSPVAQSAVKQHEQRIISFSAQPPTNGACCHRPFFAPVHFMPSPVCLIFSAPPWIARPAPLTSLLANLELQEENLNLKSEAPISRAVALATELIIHNGGSVENRSDELADSSQSGVQRSYALIFMSLSLWSLACVFLDASVKYNSSDISKINFKFYIFKKNLQMGRRRASVPSALVLKPSTVPLIRGAPKFVLPSLPSENAIHLAVQHRLSRANDVSRLGPLKEMPRLEFPVGVYGFGLQNLSSPSLSGSRQPTFSPGSNTSPIQFSIDHEGWQFNHAPLSRRSSLISSNGSI